MNHLTVSIGIYLWNLSIKKVVYDGRLGTDIPRLMKHWALNTFVDKASLKLLVSYVFFILWNTKIKVQHSFIKYSCYSYFNELITNVLWYVLYAIMRNEISHTSSKWWYDDESHGFPDDDTPFFIHSCQNWLNLCDCIIAALHYLWKYSSLQQN